MITLTCTNCQAKLEIDDGFAGGVCRCEHCGAIQTVPAHLKGKSRPVAPGGKAPPAAKTLYSKSGRSGGGRSSTGLDDLAQVVASSGLSSSRLRAKSPTAATTPAKKSNNTVALLA